MKRHWRRPELVVLVRSQPEELVLVGCKSSLITEGPEVQDNRCFYHPDYPCGPWCSDYNAS